MHRDLSHPKSLCRKHYSCTTISIYRCRKYSAGLSMTYRAVNYITFLVFGFVLVGCNQSHVLPTLAQLPTIIPSPTLTLTPTATPTSTPTQTPITTPSPTATLTAKQDFTPILSNQMDQIYVAYTCPHKPPQPNIYLFKDEREHWEQYLTVVANATCDVHHFWQQEMGTEYTAPEYVVHLKLDEGGQLVMPEGYVTCSENSEFETRGYFCSNYLQPSIEINSERTFQFYLRDGAMNPIHVLAHEWGHYIQFSLLDANMSELQADCFFGAYIQYALSNTDIIQVDIKLSDWRQLLYLYEAAYDQRVDPNGTYPRNELTYGHIADAMRLGYNGGTSVCINSDFDIIDNT